MNLSRQTPLDIARGLSVLFMVLIHTQEYFLNPQMSNQAISGFIDFLGGIPAAPVFMFLMGVGWVYSKRSTPEILIKRGAILFGTGYLLSIMRGVLPNLLHFAVSGTDYYITQAMHTFVYVDILQFSGLAMIFYAALKKFELGPKAIAAVTCGLIALNAFLAFGLEIVTFSHVIEPSSTLQLLLEHILGLFYGHNSLTFFPFLTWMVYPLIGYLFGYYLVRATSLTRYYLVSGGLGALIFFGITYLVDYVLEFDNLLYSYSGYYHHQGFENLIATGFVMFFISLCFMISKVLPKWLERPIIRWSANVTDIYFIHWVILGWLVAFMGFNTLSTPYYFGLVILVMWISDRMAMKPKAS